MDKYASEILLIAKELQEIEKNEKQVQASVKTAGWFTKMFAKGMTEESKKKVEKAVETLTQNDCEDAMLCILKKDLNSIKVALKALQKTKETNEWYDIFVNWFDDCMEKLPKSVINKAKQMDNKQIKDDLKNDEYLKKIKDQYAEQINKILQAVKNAEVVAGQATDSWEDAFTGWGGFKAE